MAGLTLLGAHGAGAQTPARMNVVVVVMDSLRADHIYGSHARTASWDKVGRQGLRFLNAYPEGMPTIPARRAIMAGKRTFPFRGWHPYRDLPPQPGWEPVGSDGEMWTATLRKAGWTTGYVTDNPHLLLPVHNASGRKFDRVELVEGQVPVRRAGHAACRRRRELDHYVPRALRGTHAERRMANYLALNPPRARREGLQRGKGVPRGDGLDRVGPHAPAAVRAGGRLL